MVGKSPCFNCKKRRLACHDKCEDYKRYRDDINKVFDIKKKEHDFAAYKANAINKWIRIKNEKDNR